MTPSARDVLRGRTAVSIKRAIQKQGPAQSRTVHSDEKLFGILRGIRTRLAQKEGVPPFVIFSDATLSEMCGAYPVDQESLLRISGVGSVKLKKFGNCFTEAIKAYVEENNIQIPQNISADVSKNQKRKSPEAISDTKEESYRLYKDGLDINEIAKERGLTTETVENHLLSCLQNGIQIDARLFVTEEEEQLITEAINRCGRDRLKPIKEALPERISYGAIR